MWGKGFNNGAKFVFATRKVATFEHLIIPNYLCLSTPIDLHFSNSESTGCLYEGDSKVWSRRYVEGEEGNGEAEVRGEVGLVIV